MVTSPKIIIILLLLTVIFSTNVLAKQDISSKQKFAKILSTKVGINVKEIISINNRYGGEWISTIDEVYQKRYKNLLKNIVIPQSLLTKLIYQNYDYKIIRKAYALSILFRSSTEEILKNKPQNMNWDRYEFELMTYAKSIEIIKKEEIYNNKKDKVMENNKNIDKYFYKKMKELGFNEKEIILITTLSKLKKKGLLSIEQEFSKNLNKSKIKKSLTKIKKWFNKIVNTNNVEESK